MPRSAPVLIAALAAVAPQPAAAGPSLNLVEAALQRGYGATCGLDMTPVARNGYYPCLDIGPYRFVSEYGRIRGFVLTRGQPPFPILEGSGAGAAFTVKGPWEQDVDVRIARWWSDEVEGGRRAREDQEGQSRRSEDAAAAVRDYGAPPQAPQAAPQPAPAAQPAPVIYYVLPPGYQAPAQQAAPVDVIARRPGSSQEIPITGVPMTGAQQAAPNGGVTVAPGVVAYPKGQFR